MSYRPQPIDASAIPLPEHLITLIERSDLTTPDLRAATRLAQGWTRGPQRDDAAKKHPCLIRYADLPESEKTYDREAALGTLRAILALGCTITPPAQT